jgi:hypothetical protein
MQRGKHCAGVRKLLPSLAFLVLPIFAQYTGLVTTEDGSQLYFSSSLRLRGTTEVDVPKIFRYSVTFELVQQPTAPGEVVVEPELSSDGTVVGYTSELPARCIGEFCYDNTSPPESGRVEGIKIPTTHCPLFLADCACPATVSSLWFPVPIWVCDQIRI